MKTKPDKQPVIETERLVLREVLPEDEAGFFEMDTDPEVHRYLGNRPLKNLDEVRDIIQMIRKQYTTHGIGRWTILDKATEAFIGWAGLKYETSIVEGRSNYYDLGYRLLKKHWGKGYATESSKASIDYGFFELGLEEIVAAVDCGNKGSANVLRKLSFTKMGTFPYDGSQHDWYLLKERDWKVDIQNAGTKRYAY